MKEILKNLKEGDILVKLSRNESVFNDITIEHHSIIIIKIHKKVKCGYSKEDLYIFEIKHFSNYNIDNNSDKWELVVSTCQPTLRSISFIEHSIDGENKGEINNYSFVVKDDTNKVWEEIVKRNLSVGYIANSELEDFMNQVAGNNWKICLNSLGYSF
jgi:hypothetical protein